MYDSSPYRSHRLVRSGHQVFILGTGVRIPLGSLQAWLSCPFRRSELHRIDRDTRITSMTLILPILTLQLMSAITLQSPQINYKPTLLSSFNLTQPVEGDVVVEKVITTWGQAGSWRWGIHGVYGEDLKNHENEFVLLVVEFDYFIANKLSLDMGLNFFDVTQTGDDTDGFNFTLQLRWHAIAKEDWSFFVEGGVGLLFTEHNVPTDGTNINFTPQVGFGFSFDANDSARWLIGLRWHHISNANTHRTNPGRDSLMLWVGMTFPF